MTETLTAEKRQTTVETVAQNSKILQVTDLQLHYFTSKGVVRALDGVSFFVNQGETLGVVGESGCGKTTMGSALLNMPSPPGKIVGGSINLDNTEITAFSETRMRRQIRWNKIAMVFQGAMNCLTPVYTIGNLMRETLQEHRRMEKGEAEQVIEEYLAHVGLGPEIKNRYPHELSGGMKQRVVIATALFLKPALVILDEPTTALDVIIQSQILNLLKELKQKFNLSFIFITHDLATEAEIADRIMVMYAGKVAEIGTGEHIFGSSGPAHPYTRKLIAATPRIHQRVDELSFIEGAPPDLLDPPSGCRFHLRCDQVQARCRQKQPPVTTLEADHTVACWRFVDGE